jgi:hypothetical protein
VDKFAYYAEGRHEGNRHRAQLCGQVGRDSGANKIRIWAVSGPSSIVSESIRFRYEIRTRSLGETPWEFYSVPG